ncbi:zinc finger protein RFP-like [Dicentrarchus labrax]|uniref:zinc finger protein RFP-like n=1 Tax=Dicentrarchus labrax TaxID=13489 RepID=UPI0021F5E933|nr:zinc finger protein RFP-like [Dicentrarchus labrax]
MAKLSVMIWKALQQLKDDEFKKFKWFLKQEDVSEGDSGISVAQLENADRQDTVDLMAQKYGDTGAIKETMKVLEKISRNDLVPSLQNSCLDPKDLRLQGHDSKKAELKSLQQFTVEVTLDPDAAHPNLIQSCDGKQVCDVRKKLLDNPERFFRCVCWSEQRLKQQKGTDHTES